MAEPAAAGLPKLRAVARAAGVSVSTVSKVLNGRPDVAPATRTRVAALLGRAGYSGVGSRRSGAGNLVEVVANRLDDPVTARLLRAVCLEAAVRGRGVVVTDVGPATGRAGRHPPRSWLDAMDARGADAVISLLMEFSDTQLSYFEAHGVTACTLAADERDLGRVAVQHLLGLGHARIAALAGPQVVLGCREALLEAGAPAPDGYLLEAADVRQGMLDLLVLSAPPSAIVFGDVQERAGWSVPRDVSAVCCGAMSGAVTTVVQPWDELARTALDLVAAGRPGAAVVAARPRLVDRGSTAPPRLPR